MDMLGPNMLYMGVSEKIKGTMVLIIKILRSRVLYWGPLFSETPI